MIGTTHVEVCSNMFEKILSKIPLKLRISIIDNDFRKPKKNQTLKENLIIARNHIKQ